MFQVEATRTAYHLHEASKGFVANACDEKNKKCASCMLSAVELARFQTKVLFSVANDALCQQHALHRKHVDERLNGLRD